jgi:hypothetical protein
MSGQSQCTSSIPAQNSNSKAPAGSKHILRSEIVSEINGFNSMHGIRFLFPVIAIRDFLSCASAYGFQ